MLGYLFDFLFPGLRDRIRNTTVWAHVVALVGSLAALGSALRVNLVPDGLEWRIAAFAAIYYSILLFSKAIFRLVFRR